MCPKRAEWGNYHSDCRHQWPVVSPLSVRWSLLSKAWVQIFQRQCKEGAMCRVFLLFLCCSAAAGFNYTVRETVSSHPGLLIVTEGGMFTKADVSGESGF